MVLGQVLHLNEPACPSPGTVGTVKLKHPSGSAVRTHSVLHRLILFNRGLGKLLTENKGIGEFRRRGLQHFIDRLFAEGIRFQSVVGKPRPHLCYRVGIFQFGDAAHIVHQLLS